jgi:hypothetical protein
MVERYKASKFGALCLLSVGLMIAFFAVVALLQDYPIPGIVMLVLSLPFAVWGVRMLLKGGTLVFDEVGIDDRGRDFRLPWDSIADLEVSTEQVTMAAGTGGATTSSITWLVATLEDGARRPEGAPRFGRKQNTIAYSLQYFDPEPEEIFEAARRHWRNARG